MSRYAVAKLDEIDEITDGREPWRPVRQHFGIRSFGVNTWTGKEAGDRIINEHDESGADDDEELYLVQTGRARFELDGESVDAPAGTRATVRRGVGATATIFSAVYATNVLSRATARQLFVALGLGGLMVVALLFVMARAANVRAGAGEVPWIAPVSK